MYDEISNQLYGQPLPGVVQGGTQGMPVPQFDMAQEPVQPEQYVPPTDEELAYAREAQADQDAAGLVPVDPQIVQTGAGDGQSVSTSRSGLDNNSLAVVDARGTKLEKKIAANKASNQAEVDQYKAGYDATAEGSKQSVLAKTDVQVKYDQIERDTAASFASLSRESADNEIRIQAESELKYKSYMADYNAQLQEIRATTMNPGKLFADMTGGDKAGMLVTAFVHDYLGTKGVKTSSMDTYNKAIERSIDAQIANLGTKKAVLSGMQQMWDMQRAQSKSDEEARIRIHGFALQSLKDTAVGKMSMFDSDFARANIPAAIADIDKAMLDNTVRLDTLAKQNSRQDAELLTTQERDRVNAARSAASLALETNKFEYQKEQNTKAEEQAAHASKAKDFDGEISRLKPLVVHGEGGKVLGEAKTPEIAKTMQNRVNGTQNLSRSMQELVEMQRELKSSYQGKGSSAFTTIHRAKLNGLVQKIKADYVKSISGAAAAEKEVERLDKVIKIDGLIDGIFGDKDVAEYVNSQFNSNLIKDTQEELSNSLYEIKDPYVVESLGGGTNFKFLEARGIEAENDSSPADISDPVLGKAIGKLNDTSGNSGVKNPSKSLRDDYSDYVADAGKFIYDDSMSSSANYARVAKKPPRWFEGMSELADAASNMGGIYDKDVVDRAVTALANEADESVPGSDPYRVYAAKFYLYRVGQVNSKREEKKGKSIYNAGE